MHRLTDATLPWWDAFILIFSLIAQWLQARKNGMLAGLAARQHGSRGRLLGEGFTTDEWALPDLLVDVAVGLARVAPRM